MHASPSTRSRFVVVGAHGYLGAGLFRYLAEQVELEVTGISSADSDFRRWDSVETLLRRKELAQSTLIFLGVINKSLRNSYDAYCENVAMAQNLAQLAAKAPLRSLVYLSSADVYGCNPEVPLNEQSRLAPDSWYALAKQTSEWILLHGCGPCPVTVLRIPGIFGPDMNDRSVIGQMVSSVRASRSLLLRGSGRVLRDYVYREDLCRLIHTLAPQQYNGILNVATGVSISLGELADLVVREVNPSARIIREPGDDRSFDLTFDTRRLRDLLPSFAFTDRTTAIRTYQTAVHCPAFE